MKKKCFMLLLFLVIISGCSNKNDLIKGDWKATTEDQKVYDDKGGIKEYILKCYSDGSYDLKEGEQDLANSTYKISKDIVTFYDEGKEILAICQLQKNNTILDCQKKSYYSFKYTKIK